MSASVTGTPCRESSCYAYTAPENVLTFLNYSATTGLSINGGKGHNGGVWEWTSTVMEEHEGFVQSKLYPGYASSRVVAGHAPD